MTATVFDQQSRQPPLTTITSTKSNHIVDKMPPHTRTRTRTRTLSLSLSLSFTAMRHSMLPSLLLLLFFFTSVTTSFTTYFPNCNQTFSCGHLRHVSYPFTGGPLPAYCGPPQFHLTCEDDQTPVLTSDSLSYRVIQLDLTHQTLTLARSDLFHNDDDDNNTTCSLMDFATHALDSTVYALSQNDNVYLTMFYACASIETPVKRLVNSFSCQINGTYSEAYYVTGEGFSDPALAAVGCNASVTVPVVKTAAYNNASAITEVLREGFSVNYSNPYEEDCRMCVKSGGLCGFDEVFGGPICICGDTICANSETDSGRSLRLGLSVGLPLFAGVVLGCVVLGIFLRRKKKVVESESESKEQLTTRSSNSATTPSTALSQSIPSYASSNLDLERGSAYFGAQIFHFNELEEATDNFNPSKQLGDGGFGIVYYGVLKDGRVVAVKRLYENNFKRAEQFMNEIEILSRLRHPNLVTLYGCTSRQSRELLLVFEYVPNGTVADHIHESQSKSGLLTWPIRLRIALETATALAYLHASDVIHRDVKTNNILLDHNFSVKVADFGMSRLFPTNVTHVSTAPQGTPGYVDPEYYQCYQLTDKSDVYSFGVVLMELISSKEAVDTSRCRHDINLANMAVNRIQNQALHELVDPRLGFENNYAVRSTMTSVAELAFRCLQQDKDLRPSMSEVREALKEIENEEVGASKAEVVDIGEDDIGLLKPFAPQLSPDLGPNDNHWPQTRSL